MALRRLAVLAALALLIALSAAPSALAAPILGFSDNFGSASDVSLSQTAGATTDRMFVRWDLIEGRRGRYSWALTDGQYKAMLAAGVRPIWSIIGAPAWARGPDCTSFVTCPQAPAYDPNFQAFVSAFAQRYPQSLAIEIGNEPNLDNKWDTPDPARYTQILKAGYTAIKAVEPQIQVLVGGICPGGASGRTIKAGDFLAGIYAHGGKGFFDGIGWHIYVAERASTVAPDVKGAMDEGRSVRDANGDNAPFWITETGFASQGVSPYSDHTVFSEQTQANAIATDYRVLSSMPDVRAIYFFRLLDSSQQGGFSGPAAQLALEQSMGFFRLDRSPKAVVQALRDAIAAGPWPNYQLHLSALRPQITSGQNFQLSVSGYTGPGPVTYQWLIWHTDHWSLPYLTTGGPQTPFHIYRPGKYSLGVRVVTPLDSYTSNAIDVTVQPKKPAVKKRAAKRAKPKHHAKKKHRAAKRKKKTARKRSSHARRA